MKVNEIFYSLQGEGHFTGHAAVFLRFSGCNLACPFCDTRHSEGRQMDEREIADAVSAFKARHIVITGGEPSLQITSGLLRRLKDAGFFIQMETNGTVDIADEVLDMIDWVTCSPKDAPVRIRRIDELKMLYINDGQDWDACERMAARYGACLSLQPCDTGDAAQNSAITAGAVGLVKSRPAWRLSLQTHKMLGIR